MLSSTLCRTILEIERSGDALSVIGCGVIIAGLIQECDVAHIAAGRPSIMPFLRDGQDDKLAYLIRKGCEKTPDAALEAAVAAAYTELRDALMHRPNMH